MSKKRTKEKSSPFSRGYGELRKRLAKRSKFTMSCKSCRHFFQAEGDKYELCQNLNVTEWDMVNTSNNMYCTYWECMGENHELGVAKGRKELDEL